MPPTAVRQTTGPTYVKSSGVGAKPVPTSGDDDNNKGKELVEAARAGDIPLIKKIIASGMPVDERGDGTTALLAATAAGKFDAVQVLLSYNAQVTARDDDGYTIFTLALNNNHPEIAEYIIKQYPDVTVTDPRLPKGAKWLKEQFKLISDQIHDPNSKPDEKILDYLIAWKFPDVENRTTSDLYWEHILLRYIGDVPRDIERNYSPDLRLSLMGTFNEFLKGSEGIKESARLLNSVLPTTEYTIKGTLIDKGGSWVTERWGYRDAQNISVEDGIDSFLIDEKKGKIMVKMINYNVEQLN